MLHLTHITKTFPSVRIKSQSGGLPIEVSLIAQIGHGAGDHLFAGVAARQKQHSAFIDELDEPSAKLGAPDFTNSDHSALYSFMVGSKGHPWHRHAGNRTFIAVSGSGGTQLRFSTASDAQIAQNPQSFLHALHCVNIPPDCIFTVRFGGNTWHQFAPLNAHSRHPAFFALSCHTNELGGDLSTSLREQVLDNSANIASLTEVLPGSVSDLIQSADFPPLGVPVTTLSLDAPAGTLHRILCDVTRGITGLMRGVWGAWKDTSGFLSNTGMIGEVEELHTLPEDTLLHLHLQNAKLHHEDMFRLHLYGIDATHLGASALMELLLQGFITNAPQGVSRLMGLRNAAVKPFGLRTSPLGCPVSSLLSDNQDNLFASKYPVLDQRINSQNTQAEVILGADDKHLTFRSCIGIRIIGRRQIEIVLGNRVHCKNAFGIIYMTAIDSVHRRYISPAMMRMAADYITTHAK